ELAVQRPRGGGELLGADVDRDVDRRALERREQHAGLLARAAARLDDARRAADRAGDRREVALEQRELRAIPVVLVERADLLEQRRAARIVEQLSRQVLVRRAQPGDQVVSRERVEAAANGWVRRFHPRLLCGHSSLARRAPDICQRAAAGKKLRY